MALGYLRHALPKGRFHISSNIQKEHFISISLSCQLPYWSMQNNMLVAVAKSEIYFSQRAYLTLPDNLDDWPNERVKHFNIEYIDNIKEKYEG